MDPFLLNIHRSSVCLEFSTVKNGVERRTRYSYGNLKTSGEHDASSGDISTRSRLTASEKRKEKIVANYRSQFRGRMKGHSRLVCIIIIIIIIIIIMTMMMMMRRRKTRRKRCICRSSFPFWLLAESITRERLTSAFKIYRSHSKNYLISSK